MIATRKGHVIFQDGETKSFPSIAKAKQASSALQKSGVKVVRQEHKQTEKTIPSRQKSPFARR